MEQGTSPQPSMTELLARRGIIVTSEGKERARRKLAAAESRRDPAAREALLARLRQDPTPA